MHFIIWLDDEEYYHHVAEYQAKINPNETDVKREIPFFEQKLYCSKSSLTKAWLQWQME